MIFVNLLGWTALGVCAVASFGGARKLALIAASFALGVFIGGIVVSFAP